MACFVAVGIALHWEPRCHDRSTRAAWLATHRSGKGIPAAEIRISPQPVTPELLLTSTRLNRSTMEAAVVALAAGGLLDAVRLAGVLVVAVVGSMLFPAFGDFLPGLCLLALPLECSAVCHHRPCTRPQGGYLQEDPREAPAAWQAVLLPVLGSRDSEGAARDVAQVRRLGQGQGRAGPAMLRVLGRGRAVADTSGRPLHKGC